MKPSIFPLFLACFLLLLSSVSSAIRQHRIPQTRQTPQFRRRNAFDSFRGTKQVRGRGSPARARRLQFGGSAPDQFGQVAPNIPLNAGQNYRYSTEQVSDRFDNIINTQLHNIDYQHPFPLPVDECSLSLELFPMYYQPATRSASFRIAFSSNCMSKRDLTFDIPFQDQPLINWVNHPTVFYVNLWDNVYRLEFGTPRIIDRYDVMRALEYRAVNIYNLGSQPKEIDLMKQNQVYMIPQEPGSFNRFNVRKIEAIQGLVRCGLKPRRMRNLERLHAEKTRIWRDLEKRTDMGAQERIDLFHDRLDELVGGEKDLSESKGAPEKKPSFDGLSTSERSELEFQVAEEKLRMDNREFVRRQMKRRFIFDFEVECLIK